MSLSMLLIPVLSLAENTSVGNPWNDITTKRMKRWVVTASSKISKVRVCFCRGARLYAVL